MGRVARHKKMKAVNDLHNYRRGPISQRANQAPDAEDLLPEDLPPAFSSALATLPENTGTVSKASKRRQKREQREEAKARKEDDMAAPPDADDGPVQVPIPISKSKKSKKETPATLLPGETFSAFTRRVDKETREQLAGVSVNLNAHPLPKRKKEYLDKKKLKKKKGKKEEDDGPDFVHTDKVRFGEQAQAPPKLTPPNPPVYSPSCLSLKKQKPHVDRPAASHSSLTPELEALRRQYIEAYRAGRAKERAQQSK